LDFAKAAEEFCDAPLKVTKGDLGTLKKGETDKTLIEALAPLKKGERTGWIEGKKGWYLLQVEDKTENRTRTFDEAKRDIEQKMFQERQAAKLDGSSRTSRRETTSRSSSPIRWAEARSQVDVLILAPDHGRGFPRFRGLCGRFVYTIIFDKRSL